MDIHVKNCMEEFVIELLKQIIKSYPDACTCDQCMSDITAWSLNHLPPRYVGTDIGDTYARLDIYDQKHYANMVQTIAQGIQLIQAHPHHKAQNKDKTKQE